MIKLSDRLEVISSYIEESDNVIDIGCDHALLDIYLAKKYNKKYIASDLRESVIKIAKENIEKYRVTDNIELRCGDGLSTIDDSINTIVIAGMGFQTIIKILSNKEKLKNINKLIIQSNSYPEKVRKYMIKNGYYIDDESIVLDRNIYYFVTIYKRGFKKYNNVDIEIGLLKKNQISMEYLDKEIKKNLILYKLVPMSDFIRKIELKIKLIRLKKKRNSIK